MKTKLTLNLVASQIEATRKVLEVNKVLIDAKLKQVRENSKTHQR